MIIKAKTALWVGITMAILGGCLIFSFIFLPSNYYTLGIQLLILFPVFPLIWICFLCKTQRINNRVQRKEANFYIYPIMSIWLTEMFLYIDTIRILIFDYQYLWGLLGLIWIILTIVYFFFFGDKKLNYKQWKQWVFYAKSLSIPTFVIVHLFSSFLIINKIKDNRTNYTKFKVKVVKQYTEVSGRGNRMLYYIEVLPFYKNKEVGKIEVNENLYRKIDVNPYKKEGLDSVNVYLYQGALGIPWYEVYK